jgi:hypothetical protein
MASVRARSTLGIGLLLVCLSAAGTAHAQSIDGFTVGGDIKAALKSHAAPSATGKLGGYDAYRWVDEQGSVVSVTAAPKTGRIVFVESDWNGDPAQAKSPVPGLLFGTTTLADIRARFGSNGFVFKKYALHMDARDIISVNGFELAGEKKAVLVLVTTQPVASVPEVDGKPQIDPGKGVLQAAILADLAYLESLWGKDRVADPKDKPVAWK